MSTLDTQEKHPPLLNELDQGLGIELSPNDRIWTENLGLVWPAQVEAEAWLGDINDLVKLGSRHLRGESEESEKEQVYGARQLFFSRFVNIENAVERYNNFNSHVRLIPLDTFIGTQRTLFNHGIDNTHVINSQPGIFNLAPDSLQARLATLESFGLVTGDIVNRYPSVVTRAPEAIVEEMVVLEELGIKPIEVVKKAPNILGVSSVELKKKMTQFEEWGVDTLNLITKSPTILSLSLESITEKLATLEDVGVKSVDAVNGYPTILTLSPELIVGKMAALESMGIRASAAVNKHPVILGYSSESIQTKLTNLEELGLNSSLIVNKNPSILSYAPDSVRDKLTNLEALGLDMGKVIEGFPKVLDYAPESVKAKMRVLYSVARAWGWDNYKEAVNSIVGDIPFILGNKSDKIRTLARIASSSLPSLSANEVRTSSIQSALIANLEGTIVAYLEEAGNINEPKDIPKLSNRYKKYGKETLKAIIAQHPDNLVVKKYLRGYPIKHE